MSREPPRSSALKRPTPPPAPDRRTRHVLLALTPALLGLGGLLLLAGGLSPNPILFLRADLGTLLGLTGLLTSALVLAGLAAWDQHQRALSAAQDRAIRDRRRFLQRLDHELKNPITAIRAGLANLTPGANPEGAGDALNSVDAQVKRISRLTADLRKLAELETRPIERAPVDLASVLEQVVDFAQDRAEAEGRRLTLTLPRAPWPLPPVPGDRDLLLLAVHNLVDNALKFTRPGDTIEVRAFEDGAQVVIEVADTGPGIPEADLAHVWEELYRGQSARGVPGSGLGLALVRAIVERHDGQVSLRSRAGQGTVFTVRLPLKAPAAPR